MAVFTVSISDGTTLSNLAVSAGRGPKGDGFTGGTYDAGTGKVTFTSNDGIGFSTDDLRGDLTEPGPIGSVTPSTGAFTSLSTTGDAVIGGDLTVEGTTTTVDSTTVAVGDKNVELAKDATTAAEADGGGITLNGASATITYSSANDYWALNKGLNVSGNVSLSGTVDGRDVASDGSKLDGIESNATADQTAGEIKTAYESNADTNAFTDAEQSKLSGIESNATADQTGAEIKTAYESNADTNAFTDSEKTKLSNIESNADVTDTANVTAAGALMDSELTSEASVKALDQGVATTDSADFAGLSVDTNTLYVDSSNNRVGIGTSSPNRPVEINTASSIGLRVEHNNGGGSFFEMGDTSGSIMLGNDAGALRIFTGGDSVYSSESEAMRIDSSGRLFVGGTDATTSVSGLRLASPSDTTSRWSIGPSTSTTTAIQFLNGNGVQGSIAINASSTSYNTSSDERLKENIADAQPASDLIDGIQVREFDWKADGEHQRYGMVAQELETVAPEAVTKGETDEDMWSVDYSKLVPMLVKEIQDLRKRVSELEAKCEA